MGEGGLFLILLEAKPQGGLGKPVWLRTETVYGCTSLKMQRVAHPSSGLSHDAVIGGAFCTIWVREGTPGDLRWATLK